MMQRGQPVNTLLLTDRMIDMTEVIYVWAWKWRHAFGLVHRESVARAVVYFVYLLISAYVPGGTQDRLLKASLDGSVLVVGRL